MNIGIQSVAASKLGDADIGFLNDIVTGGDVDAGRRAARPARARSSSAAISQVAVLRGRLGAFEKNTLDTNVNSLNVALENVTSSESTIRDADFAAGNGQPDPRPDPDAGRHERAGDRQLHAAERARRCSGIRPAGRG